jgi:uncharacterized coiled-coil DUF342 family protein
VRQKLQQDVASAREAAEAIRREREEVNERVKTVKEQEETIGAYRVSGIPFHYFICDAM